MDILVIDYDKIKEKIKDIIDAREFKVVIIDSAGNVVSDMLDVALSTRAPKDEGETITICKDADISGGVTAELKNFKRWTLYLKVAAAMDIKVELSPDGGTTWFTIPESPISFSAAGDDVIEFGYDATHIRLTASTTDAVTAIIRGVF